MSKVVKTAAEIAEKERQIELSQRPSGIQKEIDELGWRDIARELRALGFTPGSSLDTGGDFVARDDRDGTGPYIAEWRSKQKCPFPEMLRAAE